MKTSIILVLFSSGSLALSCFAQSPQIQEYKNGVPTAPFHISSPKEIEASQGQRPIIYSSPEMRTPKSNAAAPPTFKSKFDFMELEQAKQKELCLSRRQSQTLDNWKKSVRMEIEDHIDKDSTLRGQICRVRFWVHRSGRISNIDISDSTTELFSTRVVAILTKMTGAEVLIYPKDIPMSKILISFVLRTNPLYIIAPTKGNSAKVPGDRR